MYLPRLLAENLLNRINLIFILPISRRFSWLHVRVWMIKLPKKKYKLLSSLIFPSRLNRDVIPFIGDKKKKILAQRRSSFPENCRNLAELRML